MPKARLTNATVPGPIAPAAPTVPTVRSVPVPVLIVRWASPLPNGQYQQYSIDRRTWRAIDTETVRSHTGVILWAPEQYMTDPEDETVPIVQNGIAPNSESVVG